MWQVIRKARTSSLHFSPWSVWMWFPALAPGFSSLPTQILTSRVVGDSPNSLAESLCPIWETWIEFQSPGLRPGLALAVVAIWGVTQGMKLFSCPFSQLKNFFFFLKGSAACHSKLSLYLQSGHSI